MLPRLFHPLHTHELLFKVASLAESILYAKGSMGTLTFHPPPGSLVLMSSLGKLSPSRVRSLSSEPPHQCVAEPGITPTSEWGSGASSSSYSMFSLVPASFSRSQRMDWTRLTSVLRNKKPGQDGLGHLNHVILVVLCSTTPLSSNLVLTGVRLLCSVQCREKEEKS